MIRKILIHSYLQLINNSKLIRTTLYTLFAHSLIAVFIIVFNSYLIIEKEFHLNSSNQVLAYFVQLFEFKHIGWFTLGLAIFLFFGYFVFSPIGEYAIVHHLNTHESISQSLRKGFHKFHIIAKYDGMTFMFSILLYIRLLVEAFVYQINNGVVLSLFVMRFIMVALVTTCFQYAKTIIVLEGLPAFEAIKKSIALSLEHRHTTLKLVGISLLFNIRVIFNIFFVIGIPLAAIIILQLLGVVQTITTVIVYILFFGSFLFLAYANTLIEGYFRIFRYISYEYILGNTEQLEKLGIIRISKEQTLGGLFGGGSEETKIVHHDIDEMELLEGN